MKNPNPLIQDYFVNQIYIKCILDGEQYFKQILFGTEMTIKDRINEFVKEWSTPLLCLEIAGRKRILEANEDDNYLIESNCVLYVILKPEDESHESNDEALEEAEEMILQIFSKLITAKYDDEPMQYFSVANAEIKTYEFLTSSNLVAKYATFKHHIAANLVQDVSVLR